jgi:hypothetical protein
MACELFESSREWRGCVDQIAIAEDRLDLSIDILEQLGRDLAARRPETFYAYKKQIKSVRMRRYNLEKLYNRLYEIEDRLLAKVNREAYVSTIRDYSDNEYMEKARDGIVLCIKF